MMPTYQIHHGTIPGQDPHVFTKCSCCSKECEKLFRCSRCKFVAYCGKECQVQDWTFHKKNCSSKRSDPVERYIESFERKIKRNEILTEQNRGVIVEIANYANFLSAVNEVVGKDGPVKLEFEIRQDVQSASPKNIPDLEVNTNVSRNILNQSIGREGEIVTLEHVMEMLERVAGRRQKRIVMGYVLYDDMEIEYAIELIGVVMGWIGKRGPLYFEHGVVAANNKDCTLDPSRVASNGKPFLQPHIIGATPVPLDGERLRVPIVNSQGETATLESFVEAFRYVSTLQDVEQFRKNGRSYIHEGFKFQGRALRMVWGS